MKRDYVMSRLYKAPTRIAFDDDALQLQSALLGNRKPVDWDGIGIVVGAAIFVIVVWVMA